MNDMININIREDSIMTVSSREIAEHFGKNHRDVLRSIDNIIKEGERKIALSSLFYESQYTSKQNKQLKEYQITRDGFSLLVMGFTGKKALEWKLKYIEAFNKMEAELRKQSEKSLPATYEEALEALLEQVKENNKLIETNDKLTPKAEYYDNLVDRNGECLLNLRNTAKELKIPEREMIKLLQEKKHLYRENDGTLVPYADKRKKELYVVKEFLKNGVFKHQTFTTPKGRDVILKIKKGA